MSNLVAIGVLALMAILAFVVLPGLLTTRAIPSVLRAFRQHNAVGIGNAKTVDELGLGATTGIQRLTKRRDYRPRALQFLIRSNIVGVTEDGKLYLSEEKLAATRWKSN
jgi:hypothetical protein